MKPIRHIYNKKYYGVRKMLADKRFRKSIKDLKDTYARFGCPIPKDGCKDTHGYLAWLDSYAKVRSKLHKSDAYKDGIQKITGGKERISLDELNHKEEFDESFFPPLYGYVFDDILIEQGIDPKDTDFQSFLESHFFFNRQEYSESIFNIKWIRNNDTDKMELFIQILPHTTLDDIKDHFSEVKKDQEYLPKEALRNRKKIYIERDLWIIKEYHRIKAHRKERPRTKRKQESQSIEAIIQRKMPEKWGNLSIEYIHTIIGRMKRMRYS